MSASSTTTTTTSMNTNVEEPAPVADVLLSLEKDGRYLQSFANLISDALQPWIDTFGRKGDNDTSTSRTRRMPSVSEMRPEIELVASILYLAMTHWRGSNENKNKQRNRTLGMESVGIVYDDGSLMEKNVNQSGLFLSLLSRWKRRFRALSFVLLYVLPPYLVRRAGTGAGWWNPLLRRIRSPLTTSTRREDEDEDEENTERQREQERHRQRQREGLRGMSRRQYHEEQRRIMMERIHLQEQLQLQPQRDEPKPLGGLSLSLRDGERQRPSRTVWQSTSQGILATVSWLLKVLAQAERNDSTAVTLPDGNPDGTEVQDGNENENMANYFAGIVNNLVRLHLALYFLNGNFPTLGWHRLLSIRYKREPIATDTNTDTAIITNTITNTKTKTNVDTTTNENRPSYRIIGALVLAQCLSHMLRSTAFALCKSYYRYQYQRWRDDRNIDNRERERERQCDVRQRAHRQEMETKIPSSRRSIRGDTDDHGSHNSSSSYSTSPSHKKKRTCGICMGQRKDPAIAPCGHVFCWNCLMHWCVCVRRECPLCRSTCKPQSVLPIYGYT